MNDISRLRECKDLRALVAVRLGAKFPLRHELSPQEVGVHADIFDEAQRELALCHEHGISLRLRGERGYPQLLDHIHDPPPILYVKGALPELDESFVGVGIVGSRKADISGCREAAKVARSLSRFGVCVVSGLALGIDGAAHEGALSGQATPPTIAVLANGLSQVYPRRHAALAERILEHGGALVSIFPPLEPPYPYNFLNRNRIIAGLSRGVVILQAAKRSGALSTARHALEQGREVMVVPGDTANARFAGSLALLRNGATLVRGAADILEELGIQSPTDECDLPFEGALTPQSVVELLRSRGRLSFEQIEQHFTHNDSLMQVLFELEADEVIIRLPGNRFAVFSPVP
ncbi:MAG: DNA-processing protein DprA [Bdellovibrionales bacterium]|nr:DNA-processing protein DprA [Bdellovibrionales bacterium]